MSLIGLIVFALCAWCVFSHRFPDGIVTKNLLALAAIFSAIVVFDPINRQAMLASMVFLCAAVLYWGIKHQGHLWKHPDHRPPSVP